MEIGAASRSSIRCGNAVRHISHTYIESIEFDVRKFFCHLDHPAKMASAINPRKDIGRHVPLSGCGAQIKNLDLALPWTPSQLVPDRTNVVAIQKSFEQFVLGIHTLYVSHPIYGDVIRKDWVSVWAAEESWSECGTGGLGLNRRKHTFCSCPSIGNG